jgi:hypothetical protein
MPGMMQASDAPSRSDIRQRAIEFIRARFGSLSDMPQPLVPVIWVTVYRCMEVTMTAEGLGGPAALATRMLRDRGGYAPEWAASLERLRFLEDMIPIVRSSKSPAARQADSQLLTDLLKWGILGAASMSESERALARRFAKEDSEYKDPVPQEIVV